jgi:hypothetical protein
VTGRALSGVPAPGQRVSNCAELDLPVASVETVTFSGNNGRHHAALALMFSYEEDEQVARWSDTDLCGKVLELEGRDDVQCHFKPGDAVVFAPTTRARGYLMHTRWEELTPGSVCKVSQVQMNQYVMLEGFEGEQPGLYFTLFRAADTDELCIDQ